MYLRFRNNFLTKRTYFVILFMSFTFLSCSVVDIQSRKGKDFFLNTKNSQSVLGKYSSTELDSLNQQVPFQIWINSVSKNTLHYTTYRSDSLISKVTLRGKFRNGYFVVRREWDADFIVGPLFWMLHNYSTVIGLTNEKELVFLRGEGIGIAFLLVGPVGGASGGGGEDIYKRIN